MHYREPFFDVNKRGPILQMPRDVPLDGEPADVRASYEKYNSWLSARQTSRRCMSMRRPGL